MLNRPLMQLSTVFFVLAVLHSLFANSFRRQSTRFPEGSIGANFWKILGEVELSFGIWAALFLTSIAINAGKEELISYVDSLDFTECAFIVAIISIAASAPILRLTSKMISTLSRSISKAFPPISQSHAFYFCALAFGPLLGSLITEPAAMTVTALLLKEQFYKYKPSRKFLYLTTAILFVNISIGGVLTSFAAPPVLMVAKTWGWNTSFMFTHFGVQATAAVIINTFIGLTFLWAEIQAFTKSRASQSEAYNPFWITLIHLSFLAATVLLGHHMRIFICVLIGFLGFVHVTNRYQEDLQMKRNLEVGFFLAGLVVLGKCQGWWLEPFILKLGEFSLFLGATLLTAITDNAALTYIGAQVPTLDAALKHSLVAGAVTGGGLTIIANAPNPAGYGILKEYFGPSGLSASTLLSYAAVPTLVAFTCFWLF